MKLFQKIQNFKEKLQNSQKYTIFSMKLAAKENKSRSFIINRLKFKYLIMFWFHTHQYFKDLAIWGINIALNGGLIYIAYTGIFNPIHWTHRMLAFGLSLYIPTKIITTASNRIFLERKMVSRPQLYPQEIKR